MFENLIKRCFLIWALLPMIASAEESAVAVPAPKYLEIEDFGKCLASKDMSTWTAWCLPAQKPEACPEESWKQLHRLTGNDKVPEC